MPTASKYKDIRLMAGESKSEIVEIEYDFALDGGAIGALDLFKAKIAMVIMNAAQKVKTTCTSAGAATVSCGKSGDAAGIVGATAVASLTAGSAIDSAAFGSVYALAANDVVQQSIAVAALTAGKIVYQFEVHAL